MIASIVGALTLLVIIVVIAVVCCSIAKKKRDRKALQIGSATSQEIVSHFISNMHTSSMLPTPWSLLCSMTY